MQLLEKVRGPQAPQGLGRLPEAEILRKVWEQQYVEIDRKVKVRDPKEMPEAAYCTESPYEP